MNSGDIIDAFPQVQKWTTNMIESISQDSIGPTSTAACVQFSGFWSSILSRVDCWRFKESSQQSVECGWPLAKNAFSSFLTVYFRGPFTFWDFLTFDFDTKSSTYSRSKCELFSRLSIFTQYRPLSTRPYIFDLLSVNPGSKIQSRNHKAFVETKSKAIHSKY